MTVPVSPVAPAPTDARSVSSLVTGSHGMDARPTVTPDAEHRPIQPEQRLPVLDVLRGLAIGGILFANIQLMSGARASGGTVGSGIDTVARWMTNVFVDGSFFPLFSLLFGLGLTVQMARAEQKGKSLVPLYIRRLFFLMLIGVAHWFLVWDAFILIIYAALGVPLLFFRNRSARVLLGCAALCLALQILSNPLSRATDRALRAYPPAASALTRQQAELRANGQFWAEQGRRRLTSGSYAAAVLERAERFGRSFSRPSRYYPWAYGSVFAMFLLGVYAGHRGIFRDTERHLPFIRSVTSWGLGVGLLGNLSALASSEWLQPQWGSAIYLAIGGFERIGGAALSCFYAGGIILLLRRRGGRCWLTPLAPVGRMALSNYLLQSVICTTIFYGYGLGLLGRVGVAASMLLALAVFLLQVPLSALWLSRFYFGPGEWLWRSLSYGRLQPMWIRPLPATAPASLRLPGSPGAT